MQLVEVFYSIQGEGKSTGVPCIFVRVAGCNLRCKWCDTKYSYSGKKVSIEDVAERIKYYLKKYPMCDRIVFTGGEPLLQEEDVYEVMRNLSMFGRKLNYEIETNGTIAPFMKFKQVSEYWGTLTFNVSPKKEHVDMKVLEWIVKDFDYIFKFVVESKQNYKRWVSIIKEFKLNKDKVFLMPEGITDTAVRKKAKWIVKLCLEDGYRFTPRLHIWLYGKKRGV